MTKNKNIIYPNPPKRESELAFTPSKHKQYGATEKPNCSSIRTNKINGS